MAMTAGTSRQRCSGSDGQSQENLYDAEGLRCWVKENGRLSRFVYHQGELLYERSEDKEVSCHLGGGTEAAQVRSEQYYLRARYYNPVVGRFLQEDVYEGGWIEPLCVLWE